MYVVDNKYSDAIRGFFLQEIGHNFHITSIFSELIVLEWKDCKTYFDTCIWNLKLLYFAPVVVEL